MMIQCGLRETDPSNFQVWLQISVENQKNHKATLKLTVSVSYCCRCNNSETKLWERPSQ